VKNSYCYYSFGQDLSTADCLENVYNPFKFTGQWYDKEIGQYYFLARQYDPRIMRFTAEPRVLANSENR
jgi:RHS repeat-associated protein